MSIYTALILFSITILVYGIISEFYTILFRFTGLPEEKARFQVISLLTGCGFTTRESELILTTRRRRNLARITMLFGYVFNITIVSAFINVFLSLKLSQVEHYYLGILIPLGAVAVIMVFIRVPAIRAWGDRLLEAIAGNIVGRDVSFNSVMLLDHIGSEAIAVVTLHHIPEQYQGLSLAQTGLKTDTGIMVMLVERRGEKPVAAGASTVFAVGDKLTVFGNYATVCKTFHAKERFGED